MQDAKLDRQPRHAGLSSCRLLQGKLAPLVSRSALLPPPALVSVRVERDQPLARALQLSVDVHVTRVLALELAAQLGLRAPCPAEPVPLN